MEVSKSFAYVFEDKKWQVKFLLGALISIVPILNFAWYGYLIQILRNVSDKLDYPLPDWDDLGKKFVDGLVLFVIALIYSLPILLINGALSGSIAITEAITGGNSASGVYALYSVLSVTISCLSILYAVVISFFFPAIMVYYARRGTFGSCFRFRKIFGLIKENAGDYLVAWLVSVIISFGVGILAAILFPILFITCCLIPLAIIIAFFASLWPLAMSAHLFGQIGTQAEQNDVLEMTESD